MDISRAALPPRSGQYNKRDESHPLFPLYRQVLNSRAAQLLDAPDFRDWLYGYEQDLAREQWAKHPQYSAFLDWMRAEKGGSRSCCPSPDLPYGLAFPANFQFWIEGGRW